MRAATLLIIAASTLLLGVGVGAQASASNLEWVEFRAAGTPPTQFQIDRAAEWGEVLAPKPGRRLKGKLYRPEGKGPFPAVVLVPGCRGLLPFNSSWAKSLADWGYLALLVDSRGPLGDEPACSLDSFRQEAALLVFDAYGALQFLIDGTAADPDRIAVMGWSTGGFLNTVLVDGVHGLFEIAFKAAVAFYPSCRLASSGRFTVPVLVLVGARDDWSLARDCEKMAAAGADGATPLRLVVYPDAYNAFDDPSADAPHQEDYANLMKTPARGVTIGYDKAARDDAKVQIRQFLKEHIKEIN